MIIYNLIYIYIYVAKIELNELIQFSLDVAYKSTNKNKQTNNLYYYSQIEDFTCFDSFWKEKKKSLHKIMHYDNKDV